MSEACSNGDAAAEVLIKHFNETRVFFSEAYIYNNE